jgi:hypothetical protein
VHTTGCKLWTPQGNQRTSTHQNPLSCLHGSEYDTARDQQSASIWPYRALARATRPLPHSAILGPNTGSLLACKHGRSPFCISTGGTEYASQAALTALPAYPGYRVRLVGRHPYAGENKQLRLQATQLRNPSIAASKKPQPLTQTNRIEPTGMELRDQSESTS